MGEPILAVAAVDELACAEAIEKIKIDFEELPFVVDPLESLRPGGPNPREDGNVWVRPDPPQSAHPAAHGTSSGPTQDFAEYDQGRLPMGHAPDEWSFGDIDAGFKNAALILDETFITPDVSHQCLEPRTAMAYWQNGKLFLHSGTQSTYQTKPAIAKWMNIDQDKVVFISEYTGGGFGSKITGGLTMIIPALLSRKLNAPVMMRISREEEHCIGRARPSVEGRMKIGFAKDGRITGHRHVHGLQQRRLRRAGRRRFGCAHCLAAVSAHGHAPARHLGDDQYASAQRTERARRHAGHRASSSRSCQSRAQARRRPGGAAPRQLPRRQGGVRPGRRTASAATPPVASSRMRSTAAPSSSNGRSASRASPSASASKVRGVGVSLSCYVGGSTGFDGLLVITPAGPRRSSSRASATWERNR